MGRCLHAACMCILLNPVKSQSTTGCGNLWIFASVHDASHAVIPDTITSIRAHEFERCSSLTSVTLSDSVTVIGARAFSGTGLTSARLPNSVTYIGPRAFMNCDSLTFASLPNALTQIAIALFYSCDSLTALNLPDSVTSILPLAIAECPSLTSVTIPSSAVNISGSAFAHNTCPTRAYIAGAELCNCTSCLVGNQSSSAISNLPSHSISPTTVPRESTTSSSTNPLSTTTASPTPATTTSPSAIPTATPTQLNMTTPGPVPKPTNASSVPIQEQTSPAPTTSPLILNPIQSPASETQSGSSNNSATVIAVVLVFTVLTVIVIILGKRQYDRARPQNIEPIVHDNWAFYDPDEVPPGHGNSAIETRRVVLRSPYADDSTEYDDTELQVTIQRPKDQGVGLASQIVRLDPDQGGRDMPVASSNSQKGRNLPLVVVASCPHTMSLDNLPPFDVVDNTRVFDVFEHCRHLQDIGDIRTTHDCAGSASASLLDKDVIWSLKDSRLDQLSEREKWLAVKDSVSNSVWFACFQAKIRSAIQQIAQSEPCRPIRLICIQGGPITEVEHEYMSKIVTDGRRDAEIFGSVDIRISIDFYSYKDFRLEFPFTPPNLLRKSASVYFRSAVLEKKSPH